MQDTEQNLLCTEEFFKENFSIDQYLSKCTQKSDLLTLRKDLKNYGAELYKIMVEILKTETEDIINLAENLTNLNCKVDQLSSPMSQLYEEIHSLYNSINEAQISFKKHLQSVEQICCDKDLLSLKIGIINSSIYINNIIGFWEKDKDITILERAINEYSFQFLYANALGFASDNSEVFNTATKLIELLNKVFLNAFKLNNDDIILRCLRMYLNLNRQNEAEKCVKDNVVRPLLNVIFTQKNLDKSNQDINILYGQALEVLKNDMDLLMSILQKNRDMKGFNFVVNSFWSEIDKQLCDNLPNITAPGNPEQFQKRFKNTWQFLQQIIDLSEVNYTNEPSFEVHMKRFNLSVYFEIRFQEIAAKFETKMLTECWNLIEDSPKSTFVLSISLALWNGIKSCFHDDIFLIQLADQFLKLMMLLVSRYIKWFEDVSTKWKELTESLTTKKLERFVIFALTDFAALEKLIVIPEQAFDESIFKIIPVNMRQPLIQLSRINKQLLETSHNKLQDLLVNSKVEQCGTHLQQVTAIPRLYRRTNRSIPKEPSNYIIEVVTPIIELHNTYNATTNNKIVSMMDLIIAKLGDQYVSLVQEVLHSMSKTEESLRRLKNRNLNVSDDSLGQTSGEIVSDEAKIREQIKLDVEYFIKQTKPYVLSSSQDFIKRLVDECAK